MFALNIIQDHLKWAMWEWISQFFFVLEERSTFYLAALSKFSKLPNVLMFCFEAYSLLQFCQTYLKIKCIDVFRVLRLSTPWGYALLVGVRLEIYNNTLLKNAFSFKKKPTEWLSIKITYWSDIKIRTQRVNQ